MSAEEFVATILLVLVLFLVAGSALSLVRWVLHGSDEDWTEDADRRMRW